MEMDFHSGVMQGPFWSHNSYCILTWGRVRELWVSLIYKSTHLIEEGPSLQLHNLTKASPRGNITMGIRISSYEISGGHKGWDRSRHKRALVLPPPVAVVTHTPLILISCITLQPLHTFYHSGFHKSRSSQVSAPSHIRPIQCLPLPCWGPEDLPGSAHVSISAMFLLSPSLDLHSLGHVGTGKMVMTWESLTSLTYMVPL